MGLSLEESEPDHDSLEPSLQRLFSSFPNGAPGFALFFLRALVSITLFVQAANYLRTPEINLSGWIVMSAMAIVGLCFALGFMTPLMSSVLVLGALAIGLSWVPSPSQNLLDTQFSIVNLVVVAAAIGALGPGAFSLDARMFGRREIRI
ncbi:MAG TPA: hypothetical protein VFH91_01075 [Pyrinomonadaceae bacterium]|nr:hypothetical protein [Pyrinomonadaceae bacterium]